MPAHLGMIGTGSWSATERPESFREGILYLDPNGDTPLTAILAKLPSESVNDYHFHWWEKTMPIQAGPVTGVYTDSVLATAYAADNFQQGQVVYVKGAADTISEFREGHTVALEKTNDFRYRTRGIVRRRVLNGVNSFLGIELSANTNVTYDINSADIDYIRVIGNLNPQGGEMPQSISYRATEKDNVTQIFRTPAKITRTAARTRLRTKSARAEAKREALLLHAIEMEKAFIWGQYYIGLGSNGEPETATRGIATAIQEDNAANMSAFNIDGDYAGDTWLEAGEDWLTTRLGTIFRYGSQEKLALVGDLWWYAIAKLAKYSSDITIEPDADIGYGIMVNRWHLPTGGTLLFKQHPLMAYDETLRRDALIIEPQRLRFRYIDDTKFIDDPFIDEQQPRSRKNNRDAWEAEYLTEAGLEYSHTSTMGYLSGVGLDNGLTP